MERAGTPKTGDMLRLLRRKSFRKSKDLTPSVENSLSCRNPRGSGSGGQCREGGEGAGQSTASLVDRQTQGGQAQDRWSSLDRRAGSRESKTSAGRYTSIATALGSDAVHPPEILQYARPPENLTSPVRESNGYLPETSLTLTEPACDTTIQKLFFDSVINGNVNRSRSRVSRSSVTEEYSEVTSSPEGDFRPVTRKFSGGPARKSSTSSDRVARRNSGGSNQLNFVRKSSRNTRDSNHNEAGPKLSKRSVMTVLRQSFRRSKKDRPTPIRPANLSQPQNTSITSLKTSPSSSSVVKTSVTPPDVSPSQESRQRFDYSTISVASVRTGRTLTPSRISIISRASELTKPEEVEPSLLLKVQAGLKQVLSDRLVSSESLETPPSGGDNMSTSIKTVNTDYSMVGRSRTSPIITSPGTARPRCLPETPKLIPSAVPPIYANVQQQMASGNSRQMSAIAKILEENGNKRQENGVQKSPSIAQVPPAIPKPAARLSIRQKVD